MKAIETATNEVEAGPDELGALARDYGPRAFRFALQIVGNRDEAMDVVQEAFLRLHRHWGRRDPSRPLAPWLYAIVRNLGVDVLRRRSTHAAEEAGPEVADGGPGPEVLLERSQQRTALWAAIGRLPVAMREVFLLRELHGLSYAEIGEVLGVPVSTVNNRLHDARVRLRSDLRQLL